ncbi:MAG: hydroxymethylbilane synthase [Acidimicrobiales bacterium]
MRIATRGSALARWQAEHVAGLLRAGDPATAFELVIVDTAADKRLDIPIAAMGGKGVFVKEVQAAVLDGRADFAVHSAKDLPSITHDALALGAVPERGDPRDALVGSRLADLAPGAVVATGSIRRRAQLAHRRPDLGFAELRGNMQTRLAKAEGFDAIVVAAVALERLGLADHLAEVLPVDVMLPQVGQGALAVECRADDEDARGALAGIEHPASRRRVDAERAFLAELGGDCDLPAGAYATIGPDGRVTLEAVLAAPDGSTVLRDVATGSDGHALGSALARALLDAGGRELLSPPPLDLPDG